MARGDIPEASGHKPNNAVVPALVNPPVIFIAPAARTVSSGEIWMAVSCDDVNYGGCIIYASNDDGESYHRIGYLRGSSTHGVLTAPLPSATGLDTTHTLAIDVLASGGVIESPGQVSLDTHDALCFAGGEFLAFKTATPTALGFYDLTHLERGLYGSEAGSGTGAPFVMCDDKLFRYPFNANLVGHTIWLKFQGANGGQKGLQDIAELVAYPFVVSGDGGRKALQSDLEPIIASVDKKMDIVDANRHLTVLDENGATVVISLANNALPVLDETGFETYVDLVNTAQESRHSFRTYTSSHTLVLEDASTFDNSSPFIEMDCSSASSIIIPLNSSVEFPIGTEINVMAVGDGQITFVKASEAINLLATPGLKLRAKYSGAILIKRAIDTWWVSGDLRI